MISQLLAIIAASIKKSSGFEFLGASRIYSDGKSIFTVDTGDYYNVVSSTSATVSNASTAFNKVSRSYAGIVVTRIDNTSFKIGPFGEYSTTNIAANYYDSDRASYFATESIFDTELVPVCGYLLLFYIKTSTMKLYCQVVGRINFTDIVYYGLEKTYEVDTNLTYPYSTLVGQVFIHATDNAAIVQGSQVSISVKRKQDFYNMSFLGIDYTATQAGIYQSIIRLSNEGIPYSTILSTAGVPGTYTLLGVSPYCDNLVVHSSGTNKVYIVGNTEIQSEYNLEIDALGKPLDYNASTKKNLVTGEIKKVYCWPFDNTAASIIGNSLVGYNSYLGTIKTGNIGSVKDTPTIKKSTGWLFVENTLFDNRTSGGKDTQPTFKNYANGDFAIGTSGDLLHIPSGVVHSIYDNYDFPYTNARGVVVDTLLFTDLINRTIAVILYNFNPTYANRCLVCEVGYFGYDVLYDIPLALSGAVGYWYTGIHTGVINNTYVHILSRQAGTGVPASISRLNTQTGELAEIYYNPTTSTQPPMFHTTDNGCNVWCDNDQYSINSVSNITYTVNIKPSTTSWSFNTPVSTITCNATPGTITPKITTVDNTNMYYVYGNKVLVHHDSEIFNTYSANLVFRIYTINQDATLAVGYSEFIIPCYGIVGSDWAGPTTIWMDSTNAYAVSYYAGGPTLSVDETLGNDWSWSRHTLLYKFNHITNTLYPVEDLDALVHENKYFKYPTTEAEWLPQGNLTEFGDNTEATKRFFSESLPIGSYGSGTIVIQSDVYKGGWNWTPIMKSVEMLRTDYDPGTFNPYTLYDSNVVGIESKRLSSILHTTDIARSTLYPSNNYLEILDQESLLQNVLTLNWSSSLYGNTENDDQVYLSINDFGPSYPHTGSNPLLSKDEVLYQQYYSGLLNGTASGSKVLPSYFGLYFFDSESGSVLNTNTGTFSLSTSGGTNINRIHNNTYFQISPVVGTWNNITIQVSSRQFGSAFGDGGTNYAYKFLLGCTIEDYTTDGIAIVLRVDGAIYVRVGSTILANWEYMGGTTSFEVYFEQQANYYGPNVSQVSQDGTYSLSKYSSIGLYRVGSYGSHYKEASLAHAPIRFKANDSNSNILYIDKKNVHVNSDVYLNILMPTKPAQRMWEGILQPSEQYTYGIAPGGYNYVNILDNDCAMSNVAKLSWNFEDLDSFTYPLAESWVGLNGWGTIPAPGVNPSLNTYYQLINDQQVNRLGSREVASTYVLTIDSLEFPYFSSNNKICDISISNGSSLSRRFSDSLQLPGYLYVSPSIQLQVTTPVSGQYKFVLTLGTSSIRDSTTGIAVEVLNNYLYVRVGDQVLVNNVNVPAGYSVYLFIELDSNASAYSQILSTNIDGRYNISASSYAFVDIWSGAQSNQPFDGNLPINSIKFEAPKLGEYSNSLVRCDFTNIKLDWVRVYMPTVLTVRTVGGIQ